MIEDILSNIQTFNSRFVNKIKNPNTNKAYKNNWLIIQAYNNKKKDLILVINNIADKPASYCLFYCYISR